MQVHQKNGQIVFYSSRTLFIGLILLAALPICGVLFGTTIWIKLIALCITITYLYFILFVYFKRVIVKSQQIILEYLLRLKNKRSILDKSKILKLAIGPEKGVDFSPDDGTSLVIYTHKRKYYIEKTDTNLIQEAIDLYYSKG